MYTDPRTSSHVDLLPVDAFGYIAGQAIEVLNKRNPDIHISEFRLGPLSENETGKWSTTVRFFTADGNLIDLPRWRMTIRMEVDDNLFLKTGILEDSEGIEKASWVERKEPTLEQVH